MDNDIFDFNNTPNRQSGEPVGTDYERSSYGKTAYKRVQRLRRKGQRRGIEVPRLDHELSKPDKPRVAFLIIAIASAIIFVGITVAIGFLYNELVKVLSDLSGIGEFIKTMFKPDIFRGSFGTSALPAALMVGVYMLIAILFVIPVIAVIYFYRFVRDVFYMAKCSNEEFAKGSAISSRIFSLIVITAVITVIFAVLLSFITATSAKLYIGLIFGGLIIALGSTLALMIVEKIKCGKRFESMEESKKQNYLAHERALRRIKGRLNSEKRFWDSI